MTQNKGASAKAGRATEQSRSQRVVSALRVGIPSAARAFICWFGPFVTVMGGLALFGVAVATHGAPHIFVGVLGGLMMLSAFEAHAARESAAVDAKWARCVANMVADDAKTTIEVKHTFESVWDRLPDIVHAEVAQAMSAFGQDPKGLEAKPASAVPKECAPNPSGDQ